MARRKARLRHRPSLLSYAKENIRTTFRFSERTQAVITLIALLVSAAFGTIGGLTAPEINEALEPWNLRIAFGVGIFVLVQILGITPFRMWRESVWVTNIESILDALWDLHDDGVILFNAHFEEDSEVGGIPKSAPSEIQEKWFQAWQSKRDDWRTLVISELENLHKLEARSFRYVVTTIPFPNGVNSIHNHHLGVLEKRLQVLSDIIARHQPRVLPE